MLNQIFFLSEEDLDNQDKDGMMVEPKRGLLTQGTSVLLSLITEALASKTDSGQERS